MGCIQNNKPNVWSGNNKVEKERASINVFSPVSLHVDGKCFPQFFLTDHHTDPLLFPGLLIASPWQSHNNLIECGCGFTGSKMHKNSQKTFLVLVSKNWSLLGYINNRGQKYKWWPGRFCNCMIFHSFIEANFIFNSSSENRHKLHTLHNLLYLFINLFYLFILYLFIYQFIISMHHNVWPYLGLFQAKGYINVNTSNTGKLVTSTVLTVSVFLDMLFLSRSIFILCGEWQIQENHEIMSTHVCQIKKKTGRTWFSRIFQLLLFMVYIQYLTFMHSFHMYLFLLYLSVNKQKGSKTFYQDVMIVVAKYNSKNKISFYQEVHACLHAVTYSRNSIWVCTNNVHSVIQ